eukprot:304346_1
MSDGVLQCCGDSLFLKSRFGIGYTFTLVKRDCNIDLGPVLDVLTKHVPDLSVVSTAAGEICLRLPISESDKFPDMFDALDIVKDEIGITCYSILVTTLEEVFLQVNDEEEECVSDAIEQDLAELQNCLPESAPSPTEMFFRHCWALALKRFHTTKRDGRAFLCQIILPILIILTIVPFSILIARKDFSKLSLQYEYPIRTIIGGDPQAITDFKMYLDNRMEIVEQKDTLKKQPFIDYINMLDPLPDIAVFIHPMKNGKQNVDFHIVTETGSELWANRPYFHNLAMCIRANMVLGSSEFKIDASFQ